MTGIRGPADPDFFRQQVGRYGDRFYVDNLPPCDLHQPLQPPVPLPSVSVIKNGWPKYLTAWAGREAAQYAVENHRAWSQLANDEAIDLIAKASDRAKNRAAQRGTDIHLVIEDLAEGRRPNYLALPDNVQPFIGCAEQLVRDLRLKPIVSEAVVFNHTVGYGGTFDMIADSVHGRGLYDWKTRKAPTPYPEEACQGAAYLGAEYMIVEVNGQAVRQPIPDVDFLAIVTIAPDAWKAHEINEVKAWEAWTSLRHFWEAMKGSFYDGVLATPQAPRVDPDNIRDRIVALSEGARQYLARTWPQSLPTLKQNPSTSDLIRIEALVADVEAKDGATFNFAPPPNEGGQMDGAVITHILAVLETFPDDVLNAIEYWLGVYPTVRLRKLHGTERKYSALRVLAYAALLAEGDATKMGELLPNNLDKINADELRKIADQLREQLADEDIPTLTLSE